MRHSTFRQAKAFVEQGYGTCAPAKLAHCVNTIRQHFYTWYEEMTLFLTATECFQVHTFLADCNDGNSSYLGVTLPRDIAAVEAMWWNDYPIRLHSSWREFQVGMSPECDCRLAKMDVPGTVSTATDLNPREPKRLQVRAFHAGDVGKRFVIRGLAGAGQPFSQEFKLSTEAQSTTETMATVNRAGGVIKDVTLGRVVLADEDGRMLSMYEPDETVPTYRRIKITGLRSGCDVVNIRGARRFFPLAGDDDIVETDNQVVFDSMARYLRLYERSDKTRETMAAEKDHYATAFKMMMGDKARDHGRGTASNVQILTPSFGGRSRLNRLSGRGGGHLGW